MFNTFFINPLNIFITQIVFLYDVRQNVIKKYRITLYRFKFIYTRCTGIIKGYNSIIQHFNPVCRAARSLPNLTVSKFLISLNDFDTESNYSNIDSKFPTILPLFLFPIRFMLVILEPFLPIYFYNFIFDFISICLICIFIFVLFLYISSWVTYIFVLFVAIAVLYLGYNFLFFAK